MQCMPGFLSALNDPYTVYYNGGRDKEDQREHLGDIRGSEPL